MISLKHHRLLLFAIWSKVTFVSYSMVPLQCRAEGFACCPEITTNVTHAKCLLLRERSRGRPFLNVQRGEHAPKPP